MKLCYNEIIFTLEQYENNHFGAKTRTCYIEICVIVRQLVCCNPAYPPKRPSQALPKIFFAFLRFFFSNSSQIPLKNTTFKSSKTVFRLKKGHTECFLMNSYRMYSICKHLILIILLVKKNHKIMINLKKNQIDG